MEIDNPEHIDREHLEYFATGKLSPTQAKVVKRHLYVCAECRDQLLEVERFVFGVRGLYRGFDAVPLDETHQTGAGPIRLQVQRMSQSGPWSAGLSGPDVECGGKYDTALEANEFLLRSFREMFPGHQCSERCGSSQSRPHEPASQPTGPASSGETSTP